MDNRSKKLLIVVILAILISITLMYYRYMVLKKFVVITDTATAQE